MAERPTFLTIIAILLALYGLVLIFLGLALVVLKGDIEKAIADAGLAFDALTALGVGCLIVGLLAFIVAYLLMKGIKLGWYLAVIFLIINAVIGILSLPAGILGLILTVVLIWYFFRPRVRAFFGT